MTVETSVPVDERTRARLEQLRVAIERETGRSVTPRELLARLVEREFEDREAVVDAFRQASGGEGTAAAGREDDEFEGLSEAERDRWLSGTTASGNPVAEDEIDEVLYGSPDEFEGDG